MPIIRSFSYHNDARSNKHQIDIRLGYVTSADIFCDVDNLYFNLSNKISTKTVELGRFNDREIPSSTQNLLSVISPQHPTRNNNMYTNIMNYKPPSPYAQTRHMLPLMGSFICQ